MEIQDCIPQEVEPILEQIKHQYQIDETRQGIHVSDLLLCLRASYWNKTAPLPPTDEELSYFIRGLAMQQAILQGLPTEVMVVDGIVASPDYYKDGILMELKTTMIGKKRLDNHEIPEHWIKQMMAYCYVFSKSSIILLVFPIVVKSIPLTYKFIFTPEELRYNWTELLIHDIELRNALEDGVVPDKVSKEEEWLCASCRYALRCAVKEVKP